jgi:hypothetical protein
MDGLGIYWRVKLRGGEGIMLWAVKGELKLG